MTCRILTVIFRYLFEQVDEKYVFTVADTSRVDSLQIVVENEGHNALTDFDGPAKVRTSLTTISMLERKMTRISSRGVQITTGSLTTQIYKHAH